MREIDQMNSEITIERREAVLKHMLESKSLEVKYHVWVELFIKHQDQKLTISQIEVMTGKEVIHCSSLLSNLMSFG